MQLGTIKLTCYRVHQKLLRNPQARPKHHRSTPVNQISEKILKGKAIENNIRLLDAGSVNGTLLIVSRYADEQVIPQPSAFKHSHEAVKGRHGVPVVFNFHYRSHSKLLYKHIYGPCSDQYRCSQKPRLHPSKRISRYSNPRRGGGRDEAGSGDVRSK